MSAKILALNAPLVSRLLDGPGINITLRCQKLITEIHHFYSNAMQWMATILLMKQVQQGQYVKSI